MVRMEKRPTTATLIKPSLLDTRLLGIFDMTTVSRKHLLAIKNLVHSTPRCKCKSTISVMKTFTIDCESAKADDDNNVNNISVQKARKEFNKTYRIRRHLGRSNLPDPEEHASSEERKPKVPCIPIPCATCGRQNQPERFHSHPSRHPVTAKEALSTTATDERKTVQKPVPIKFRSAKTKSNDTKETFKSDGRRVRLSHAKQKEQKSAKGSDVSDDKSTPGQLHKENTKSKTNRKEATRKITLPHSKQDDSSKVGVNNSLKTPSYEAYKLDTWIPAPVSGERKRKVVCNLCSQEFGTALLPSHEARCIQKYLGEISHNGAPEEEKNDIKNQKGILSSQAKENWKLAWELTQTVLIACKCCGRKFLPNRVEAHEKICSLKSSNRRHLRTPQPLKLDVKCCESERLPNARQKDQSPLTLPQSMSTTNSLERMVQVKMNSSYDEKENNHAECDTIEVFWKAHQAQLVPCTKCDRTFYPHRLEVHMRGCKEINAHKKKPAKMNRYKIV